MRNAMSILGNTCSSRRTNLITLDLSAVLSEKDSGVTAVKRVYRFDATCCARYQRGSERRERGGLGTDLGEQSFAVHVPPPLQRSLLLALTPVAPWLLSPAVERVSGYPWSDPARTRVETGGRRWRGGLGRERREVVYLKVTLAVSLSGQGGQPEEISRSIVEDEMVNICRAKRTASCFVGPGGDAEEAELIVTAGGDATLGDEGSETDGAVVVWERVDGVPVLPQLVLRVDSRWGTGVAVGTSAVRPLPLGRV